jgi:hypothetical protein
MSAVCLDVQPLEVHEWAFAGPAISNHPPTELFDGLEIEIECLRADSTLNGVILFAPVGAKVR